MNFNEIDQLNIIEYMQYLHDAFINKLNQTEEGREYLENAYMLTATEPNRAELRKMFGEGE